MRAARRSRAPTAWRPAPGRPRRRRPGGTRAGRRASTNSEKHQRLDDHQPQPALGRAGVRSRGAGRSSCEPSVRDPVRLRAGGTAASRSGSTKGVSSTSQHDGDQDHLEQARRPRAPGRRSSMPLSAKTEVPTNEQAATVTTAATADGRRRPGGPGRRGSRRRPGPAPSGRRRGRPAARGRARRPATKPSTARTPGRGPARRATTTSRHEVGHDAVRRTRCGEHRDLEDERRAARRPASSERARRHQRAHSQASRRPRSTARSLVGVRSATTTPTRSSDAEVDVRLDDRPLGAARAGWL